MSVIYVLRFGTELLRASSEYERLVPEYQGKWQRHLQEVRAQTGSCHCEQCQFRPWKALINADEAAQEIWYHEHIAEPRYKIEAVPNV